MTVTQRTVYSVVSAVACNRTDYLGDVLETLKAQEVPDHIELEWQVHFDGPVDEKTEAALRALLDEPWIEVGFNYRWRGIGITRTKAATRARGEYIKNLDGDDLLTPGQIAREIAVFESRPEVMWSGSEVTDLHPDGSTSGYDRSPAGGIIPRDSTFNYWMTHDYVLNVHPTTMCIRRQALWLSGAWGAVETSEDTWLMHSLNTLFLGYFHSAPGTIYRKWDGQITATEEHNATRSLSYRREAITRRVLALREVRDILAPHFDGEAYK
ncbi:glycosyltransferase family 2 protein [Corynebacterium endometrii]|uniref:Glycosyl transferase family 2 n=1 Tax=Corynebacterium endometrii TaxID=2488819 RepID=A0A4P7QGS1_9CORY|nr:Glycosyl transferase family 2 [Corynebacterium endometrii]